MIPDDVILSPRYLPTANRIDGNNRFTADFRNATVKMEPSSTSASATSSSSSSSTRYTRPHSFQPPPALKTIRRRRCRQLRVSAKMTSLRSLRGPKRKYFGARRDSRCDPGTSRDHTADRAVPSCAERNDGADDRFFLAPMTSQDAVSQGVDVGGGSGGGIRPSSTAAAPTPTGPAPPSPPPPRPRLVVCPAETRISTETVDRRRTTAASNGLFSIPVPIDPRLWSRLDVRAYLDHARHLYDIRDLDLDRFPMNGKGLCVLSQEMFQFRVPRGGTSLYLDFQRRFRRALELQ